MLATIGRNSQFWVLSYELWLMLPRSLFLLHLLLLLSLLFVLFHLFPLFLHFLLFLKFAFFNLVVLYFDSANKHLCIYQWSTLFTHLMVSANILTIENNCAHRVRVSLYDKNSFKIWFLQKGHFIWSWILSTPKSKTLGESLKTPLGLTFIS